MKLIEVFDLVLLADALRTAQREYMADRGNDSKGAAVAEAARRYDVARAQYK